MKAVILVIGQLPPPVHGTNVMTERFMGALKRNRFQPVLAEKRFSQKLEEVEVPSIRKVFKIPPLLQTLRAAIRWKKPELCVFFISVGWTSFAVDSLLAFTLKVHRIPYVLYFHGAGFSQYERRKSPMRFLVRVVLSAALGGIILGPRLSEDVSPFLPRERLFVLPNGVPDIDSNGFTQRRPGANGVNVLFLSNLVDFKGPMEFLKMAKLVTEREGTVHFTLAGKPASREYFEKLTSFVRENGLAHRVRFAGEVRGQQKKELFQGADIFILPTLKDTFGLVNVEAMQWSLPVVSSPQGSIPDVVQDGISGYIIDPRDTPQFAEKVLRLAYDPEMRAKMGAAGRRAYEKFYSLEAYERNVAEAVEFFRRLNRSDAIHRRRRAFLG